MMTSWSVSSTGEPESTPLGDSVMPGMESGAVMDHDTSLMEKDAPSGSTANDARSNETEPPT